MNTFRLNYPPFEFTKVRGNVGRSRVGVINTPHGAIHTPGFIFCATKANVKTLTIQQVQSQHTQFLLCNTYHLMLSPGADVIQDLGGLHSFMNWSGPLLTDSGGYQIFSMDYGSVGNEIKGQNNPHKKSLIKVDEHGATFRSHRDGAIIHLTPERCMDIQCQLGADLIVQLDHCTPFHQNAKLTRNAMYRSIQWGDRCLNRFAAIRNEYQALYSVVQGGVYRDLRRENIQQLAQRPFFGTAIGGSLGINPQQMFEVVDWTTTWIHQSKHKQSESGALRHRPIHLLGIGRVEDILRLVPCGIDTFDCVYPTRLARHGCAIMQGVSRCQINLNNAKYRRDSTPLNTDDVDGIQESRAYIHHLLKSKELLAHSLLSLHNIRQMNHLMRQIRDALKNNCYHSLCNKWLDN